VPELLLGLGVPAAALVYAGAWSRRAPLHPARFACFLGACVALLVAMTSPLADAADRDLTAHMGQHLLLLAVAAPLLAAARPFRTMRGMPAPGGSGPWRRTVRRWTGQHRIALVVAALALQIGSMALFHVPLVFDAAARDPWLHALEHGALLGGALALWSAALVSMRAQPALVLAVLFVDSIACTALGAAMMLSSAPWYSAYDRGSPAAALRDQQIAGALMWGYAGLAIVIGSVAIALVWLGQLDRVAAPTAAAHTSREG
jgi:putative membrane protein